MNKRNHCLCWHAAAYCLLPAAFCLLSAAYFLLLLPGQVIGQEKQQHYEFRQDHHPDGTGKFFMGREIARVMSHKGAGWLERPKREAEERPSQLLPALNVKEGDVVADVGAGSGFHSFRLAQLVGPKGKVYAVDVQPQMLALIRNRLEKDKVTNVVPVLGTATDPKLPSGAVDLILLVDVYHEFSHPYEMMVELIKTLKPGGRIAFVEFRLEDPKVPIKQLHRMAEKQVVREMSIHPLRHAQTLSHLPWQHLILFAKGEGQEAREPAQTAKRRILYNLDGDSCMFLKKGSKGPEAVTTDDMKTNVHEVTGPKSQVDTFLVCINAQVTYYPSKVGTMRGTDCTPQEKQKWPATEQQRFRNLQAMFDAGTDPYAVLLKEAKQRGREALLTFRMNDAHGNDFLRTAFWRDHPAYRLGRGALDFKHDAVRDYVFRLIEEAVQRYDCDGIELDFQRFPTFFKDGTTEERVGKINALVERIRKMIDKESRKRGRRLVLGARIPSDYGRSPPSYEKARAIGCDPKAWAQNGWVDFLIVSEFLYVRYDLPLRPWKQLIPNVPIYGSIECAEGGQGKPRLTADQYRRAARHLWSDGADGIYLFNFFTTREWGQQSSEPPFAVLDELGDPKMLAKDQAK